MHNSTERMQINPDILVYLPARGRLSGGGLRCYFFKILRMLEKRKATYNCNLSNLMGSQQSLKKTAALVLTMISLLNALLLTIQYTLQDQRRRLGRLFSEGQGLEVESAHSRKR